MLLDALEAAWPVLPAWLVSPYLKQTPNGLRCAFAMTAGRARSTRGLPGRRRPPYS